MIRTCETWFQDNNRTIPAGQDLRENYHAVTQMANRAATNSETGFAICIAASRWQTNAQRAMNLPDSPNNQARRNRNEPAQARKAAATRLHRTVGNSLSSLHTSMNTYSTGGK